MKKPLILLLVILSIKFQAQVDITFLTFESYSFSDKVTTNDGYNGEVGDGFQYGGGFEFAFRELNAIELVYQRLGTDAYFISPSIPGYTMASNSNRGDFSVDYIMAGGTRYQPFTDKIHGFSSVDAGLGIFNLKGDYKSNSAQKFCWGLRLGLKFKTNDKISIRVHGQVLSAVQALGGGMYIGTGGAGAGLSGYSTFWQFNLGGSINFLLNGKKKESAPATSPTTEP